MYSVPHAIFETPFTKIGVCPEFCSSVTFPELMGPSLASEMLFFGRRLTSQEAVTARLVGEIIPAKSKEEFMTSVLGKIRPALAYPNSGKSMSLFKQLTRNAETIARLEHVHRNEMIIFDQRSTGDQSDAAQGIRAMLAGAKKNPAKL